MVADRFKVDPIAVLRTGYFDWAVRLAAFEMAVEAEAKAQKKTDTSSD